jgi:hypothetical protein
MGSERHDPHDLAVVRTTIGNGITNRIRIFLVCDPSVNSSAAGDVSSAPRLGARWGCYVPRARIRRISNDASLHCYRYIIVHDQ